MKRFFFMFLPLLKSLPAFSLEHHAQGWHWYEDLKKAPQILGYPQPQKTDPVQTLTAFKKRLEALKAEAVMNPTFQNVLLYMKAQKVLLERSSQFAQRWMEVVYSRPEMDYTLAHPISQVGRHVYADTQKKEMQRELKKFSQTHGLFFFYSSSCGYCKAFAPIVKNFAHTYGWKVFAISLDGSILPEFPDARRNNGSAEALGIQALPALLAVEPLSGGVIPLSYGLSTQDQIEDRMRVLLLKKGP